MIPSQEEFFVHSFPLVHLFFFFFFFFLPSLNTTKLFTQSYFLDQICGSYSVMTRKEGDHIKKQFVLFLAELSTLRKRTHRVQMALNECLHVLVQGFDKCVSLKSQTDCLVHYNLYSTDASQLNIHYSTDTYY